MWNREGVMEENAGGLWPLTFDNGLWPLQKNFHLWSLDDDNIIEIKLIRIINDDQKKILKIMRKYLGTDPLSIKPCEIWN